MPNKASNLAYFWCGKCNVQEIASSPQLAAHRKRTHKC